MALWPAHLDGISPVEAGAIGDALDGIRREQRESRRHVAVEIVHAIGVDGPGAFFALELAELPERPDALINGRVELDSVDLFTEEAYGTIVEIDEERRLCFASFRRGTPRPGHARVYPFDFLESQARFYESCIGGDPLGPALARGLAATLGARRTPPSAVEALPFDRLWSAPWGTLWGPPGTGKTSTLAREVAARVAEGEGRVLFVSTTNRATDVAALRFGAALQALGQPPSLGRRVGSGAETARFVEAGLASMFGANHLALTAELARLELRCNATEAPDERAELESERTGIRAQLSPEAADFVDPPARVVFTTLHAASKLLGGGAGFRHLREDLERGAAPFDSLVVDEAGQVPRVTVAMLSLLASRRVVLAGDPRQLAPVSRAERVFSPTVKRFLTQSAIDTLSLPSGSDPPQPDVLFLDVQHRSNAAIGALVSRYQYDGRLGTSEAAAARPPVIEGLPAAVLLLLDSEPEAKREPARVRAVRPRGGQGWERPLGLSTLRRMLATYPALRDADTLLISPFRGQLTRLEGFIEEERLTRWRASTVHAQQGTEADVVVFDPVHASSTGWDEIEWRRIVNVAISRAREAVVIFASEKELRQPFLAPLTALLGPSRLGPTGFEPLPALHVDAARAPAVPRGAYRIGDQLALRRRLEPVLGHEQERLRRLSLDAGPRLVRGVAGSGKTLIAASWAIRTLRDAAPDARLLFVYGNQALAALLRRTLHDAAQELGVRFPDPRLELAHAGDLLARLALGFTGERWDYEGLAAALEQSEISPELDALFIDEAQDLGESALRQLVRFVKPTAEGDEEPKRAVRIFYDDAQEIYGRARPLWTSLGLDLRGRSVVMRESYRSTKAIGELSLNTLEILGGFGAGFAELEDDQLIAREPLADGTRVRSLHHLFDGPPPTVRAFERRTDEWRTVADWIHKALTEQALAPADVKILAMNLGGSATELVDVLRHRLGDVPVRHLRRGQGPSAATDELEILTPHAMKGYEADLVFVIGADRYQAEAAPKPRVLYTAMTRARSLLFVSGTRGTGAAGDAILDALATAKRRLGT